MMRKLTFQLYNERFYSLFWIFIVVVTVIIYKGYIMDRAEPPPSLPLPTPPSSLTEQVTGVYRGLPGELVFVIIACCENGSPGPTFISYRDQMQTLIKSAALLTRVKLRFLIISDCKEMYDAVTSEVAHWPVEYKNKVVFELHAPSYPQDGLQLKNVGKPCVTQHILAPPSLFDRYDAIIFLDTDMLFLRPPEELWANFGSFDAHQMVGMAGEHLNYKYRKPPIPHYGVRGLNGGLVMMNLTRIKASSESWVNVNVQVYNMYKHKMVSYWIFQDIYNVLFNKHPDWLHQLTCDWNYHLYQCGFHSKYCDTALKHGVSILHGSGRIFFSNTERPAKSTYEIFRDHKLGSPTHEIYDKMVQKFKGDVKWKFNCYNLKQVTYALGTRLHSVIAKL